MATGDYGVGILGTSLTSTIYQQAANQSQLYGYNYADTAGLGAFQISYAPNYTITLTNTEPPAPQKSTPRWKQAARAIDRLRGEISDWHGDVLMRKAYA